MKIDKQTDIDKSRQVKILFILSGLNSTGGIESFCKVVVPKIDLTKLHIDFLISELEPEGDNDLFYKNLGCHIYRINSDGNLIKRISNKIKFFKNSKTKYDIVHIHTVFTTAYYFAKLSKKYFNAKVIVHSHTASNYDHSALKNKICRPLINKYADYRLACSKNAAKFLFGGKKANTAEIVFNPVNVDNFKFNEAERLCIRSELNLTDERVLLIVGRLATAKNHKFLLKVFSELCKDFSNYKLLICGDGEKRSEIEKQITELRLTEKVILLGNRKDVANIMSASDCFILPSLYEGLPIVIIEAQSNGLPILISNNITKEVIVDNSAKILPLSSVTEWKNELIKITEKNIRIEAKREVISKIKERFSAESVVDTLQNIYLQVSNADR